MTTPVAPVIGTARHLLPDAAFDVVLSTTFAHVPKLKQLLPTRK